MSSFFAYLHRMRYIQRWGLMKNASPENLAEHTLDVALLSFCLGSIARDVLLKDVDPRACAVAALFHDAPEILTGDLPTPVKYYNPDITKAYKQVEKNAEAKLRHMLPKELLPSFGSALSPKDDEVLRLVRAADKLSAYIKCIDEGKAGNREFLLAREQIRSALDGMACEELRYFEKTFLPAYEKTLDELD